MLGSDSVEYAHSLYDSVNHTISASVWFLSLMWSTPRLNWPSSPSCAGTLAPYMSMKSWVSNSITRSAVTFVPVQKRAYSSVTHESMDSLTSL